MRWPSVHVLPLAVLAAATLSALPAGACPRSELGRSTSLAWLERVEYRHEGRDHTLVLHLTVEDAPVAERIQVDGQPHTAAIEHYTPMTLARWSERVMLLFGGASKFLLGTVEDLDTGDVAVIPFAALRSVTVAQGHDFDDNAPYSVRVELALLHHPAPFDGARRPFEPLSGVEQVASWYVETIPNHRPDVFDPYGQSYGEYFAAPSLVLSFVHGPPEPDMFRTPQAAKPYTMNAGLAAGLQQTPDDATVERAAASAEGEGPVLDLYDHVARNYALANPTVALEDLAGRRVALSMVGDRGWNPPTSPYSSYHEECVFVRGREAQPVVQRVQPSQASLPGAVPLPWTERPRWTPHRAPWLSRGLGAGVLVGVCAGGLWFVRRRRRGQ